MRLLRTTVALSIACFFALMWGFLLRERISYAPPPPLSRSYSSLLRKDEQSKRILMGIYFGKARIGRSMTTIEKKEDSVELLSTTSLNAKQLGAADRDVEIEFKARFSPLKGLRSFRATSKALALDIMGSAQGDILTVRGTFGGKRVRMKLDNSQGPTLSSLLSPFGGLSKPSEQRVGESWSMNMVNPLAGTVETVTAQLSSSMDLEVSGGKVRVYKITFFAGGQRWHAWVDEDGEILVQDTPLPLPIVLVREDTPQALRDAIMQPEPSAKPAP